MEDFDMALFRRILEVNATAAAQVSKHFIPLIKQAGAGSIINISSVQAYIGTPVYSAYTASKAAICGLTRVWAKELVAENITVNAICPGFVHTDMFEKSVVRLVAGGMTREDAIADIVKESPQKRPIQPSEIGDLAVFLASGLARSMTGQSLHLDGGIAVP
jgi:3-hydroxybutyrate dehydrogenase